MEKGVSLETDLITFTKIDSQWVTDLNENHKIIKLLEKNRRNYLNIIKATHGKTQ